MSSTILQRVSALSGIVAVGLLAAHFFLTDPYDSATEPDPSQPSAMLAQALINNRDDALLGAYVGMAGVFFLIWFLGYLHRHLRRAEGQDGWLAAIAYGGGLVVAGIILVLVGFAFAASELSSYGDDTQVAKTYFVLSWNAFSMLAPPAGALVIATAVSGLSYAVFPRAFNWFSLLAGALIVAVAVSGADGLAAFIALAWMAVASLVLTVDAWRHPTVPTA